MGTTIDCTRSAVALAVLVLFTVLLIAPSACDHPVTEEPVPEPEHMRVVTVWDGPKSFHPLLNWSPGEFDTVTALVHGTLFRMTTEGTLEPFLAEEISASGNTVTITLHSGLTWHDGEPVTAEDVEFFLRILLHPDYTGVDPGEEFDFVYGVESYRTGEADGIAGVSIEDEKTIRFRVDPGAGIWNLVFLTPAPLHLYGEMDPADLEDALRGEPLVGCGPYEFDGAEEEEHGTLVTLTRFEEFPLVDAESGDDTRRLQILVTGDVEAFCSEEHHALLVPGRSAPDEVEGFRQEVLPAEGFEYLGLNLANPVLAHPEVRQAIAMAVDRSARAADMFGSRWQLVGGPVPWEVSEVFTHDPTGAERLLSGAGFLPDDEGILRCPEGDPVHLRLAYPAGDEGRETTASGIAADLARVGLDVTPVAVQRDLFIYNIFGRHRFDMYLLAMPWRLATAYATWSGENAWGYEGPGGSPSEISWSRAVVEDVPVVFLFAPQVVLFVADDVHFSVVSGVPPLGDLFLWKWDREAGN